VIAISNSGITAF